MTQTSLDLGDLQALLARIKGLRVACVGDLMLDRYVYGEVSRISPEAPIPVLKAGREVSMLGGVGNVARNVAALGGLASLGAVIGDDPAGQELAKILEREVGIVDHVERRADRQSIVKTRYVAGGQQLLAWIRRLNTSQRKKPTP